MNKKQKRTLWRIVIAAFAFAVLLVLDHTGVLGALPGWGEFALYFAVYVFIGGDVLQKAGRHLLRGNLFDENFLMSLATLAAFALALFGTPAYAEALAVMLLYQIGELFQSCALSRSRGAIGDLMEMASETANLVTETGFEIVDPEDVEIGDFILVKPGEKIPLDGVVTEGEGWLDTRALTGESAPVFVSAGEAVCSGFVNGETPLTLRVTKRFEDSTVSKVLELVETATDKKARLENFITRFAKHYTPVVTVAAVLLALLLPLLGGFSWSDGIRRACNFLIVSCPCALVISVPLGFFGGIGAASRIGVLVKGSNFLEAACKLKILAMDKTGTLTEGAFHVTAVLPAPESGFDEKKLLSLAASGERMSNHPVALALREAAKGEQTDALLRQVAELPGRGVRAVYDEKPLLIGTKALLESEGVAVPSCEEAGTHVHLALDGVYLGCITVCDTIKPGAEDALQAMRSCGVTETVLLTGDRETEGRAVAQKLGIDRVRAQLLPGDKVEELEKLFSDLPQGGALGYAGDGINDAPVLMRADVGFAMGALGSDAAVEAADIVLMHDDLQAIPKTIRIAQKTMRIVKSNVAFALGVKAAILILSLFGLAGMWMAVFGDVGVAVLCVLNSMRLLK